MQEAHCTRRLQLYGEAICHDVYRIRRLDQSPDVIFDIGAQVGMFTILAAVLYPNARVIAVEPHRGNYEQLRLSTRFLANVTCIRAAIGTGEIHTRSTQEEPGESAGFGSSDDPESPVLPPPLHYTPEIEAVDLEMVAANYPGSQCFWKIDIEGAEELFIFGRISDAPLRQAANLAMELHTLGSKERGPRVRNWIASFQETHSIELLENDAKTAGILHLQRL